MTTTLVVLLAGVLGAAILLAVAALRGGGRSLADPADPGPAEHWLVERAAEHPSLQRVLRYADHRVSGGVAVAAGFVVVFVAALVVGWIFETIDTDRGFARWDGAAAEWGPDHADDSASTVLSWFTHLGGTPVVAVLMVIVAVVDYRRFRQPAVFAFMAIVGIGTVLINNGLKLLVMRDRPQVGQLVDAAGSSFPSGHSATSAACWLAMAIVAGRWTSRRAQPWLTAGAVAIACVVAASRVLLGVHWLTDVVAGLIVGWTWCFLVAIAFGGRLQRFGAPMREIVEEAPSAPLRGVGHG